MSPIEKLQWFVYGAAAAWNIDLIKDYAIYLALALAIYFGEALPMGYNVQELIIRLLQIVYNITSNLWCNKMIYFSYVVKPVVYVISEDVDNLDRFPIIYYNPRTISREEVLALYAKAIRTHRLADTKFEIIKDLIGSENIIFKHNPDTISRLDKVAVIKYISTINHERIDVLLLNTIPVEAPENLVRIIR